MHKSATEHIFFAVVRDDKQDILHDIYRTKRHTHGHRMLPAWMFYGILLIVIKSLG